MEKKWSKPINSRKLGESVRKPSFGWCEANVSDAFRLAGVPVRHSLFLGSVFPVSHFWPTFHSLFMVFSASPDLSAELRSLLFAQLTSLGSILFLFVFAACAASMPAPTNVAGTVVSLAAISVSWQNSTAAGYFIITVSSASDFSRSPTKLNCFASPYLVSASSLLRLRPVSFHELFRFNVACVCSLFYAGKLLLLHGAGLFIINWMQCLFGVKLRCLASSSSQSSCGCCSGSHFSFIRCGGDREFILLAFVVHFHFVVTVALSFEDGSSGGIPITSYIVSYSSSADMSAATQVLCASSSVYTGASGRKYISMNVTTGLTLYFSVEAVTQIGTSNSSAIAGPVVVSMCH